MNRKNRQPKQTSVVADVVAAAADDDAVDVLLSYDAADCWMLPVPHVCDVIAEYRPHNDD